MRPSAPSMLLGYGGHLPGSALHRSLLWRFRSRELRGAREGPQTQGQLLLRSSVGRGPRTTQSQTGPCGGSVQSGCHSLGGGCCPIHSSGSRKIFQVLGREGPSSPGCLRAASWDASPPTALLIGENSEPQANPRPVPN